MTSKQFLKVMATYTEGLGMTVTKPQLSLYFKFLGGYTPEQLSQAWEQLSLTLQIKSLPLPAEFLAILNPPAPAVEYTPAVDYLAQFKGEKTFTPTEADWDKLKRMANKGGL